MLLIKKIPMFFLMAVIILSLAGCGTGEKKQPTDNISGAANNEGKSIFVYAGAGLKKPMEEIKKAFKEKYGVEVEYTFGGSAQLLSQIELSKKGDVLITGSMDSYKAAEKKNLVDPYKEVALHIPVIGVPKDNPAGIKTLEDLAKPGVKVILGDEKANAIGMAAQRIIEKSGLNKINENVIAKTATVNELAVHLTTTPVDAAIITADAAVNNKDIKTIEIPEEVNSIETIPICSLKSTQEFDLANKFVDFVASDQGKAIFEKHGFKPVK